jgi:PAS domain-containing protein
MMRIEMAENETIEEPKVAEQEIRAQNTALLGQHAAINEHVHHYRELFLQSPAPVLVTDLYGTIAEANLAAGRLFRRDPGFLARKPLAAMIPPSRRDDFRRRFTRFSPADGAREWCFTINRLGDVPIEVCATVKLVGGIGPTNSGVLYWLFSGCA